MLQTDTEIGYRTTRKPPIPVEAFAGCIKPNRTTSVEQMYNQDIPKPPLKPPLPHDALKTVIKKPAPPTFNEDALITNTQSFFRLVKRKAMATERALENLLATWEAQLTSALRDEIIEAQRAHTAEVMCMCMVGNSWALLLTVFASPYMFFLVVMHSLVCRFVVCSAAMPQISLVRSS